MITLNEPVNRCLLSNFCPSPDGSGKTQGSAFRPYQTLQINFTEALPIASYGKHGRYTSNIVNSKSCCVWLRRKQILRVPLTPSRFSGQSDILNYNLSKSVPIS